MALSRGFPRVDSSTTLLCDVRTFLGGLRPRGCLACIHNLAARGGYVKGGCARSTSKPEPACSDPPQQADDASEHLDLLAADRLHRVVLGLQADVVGFAEEALDGRLLAQ